MSQARMEFVLKYVLEEGYKIDRNQESYVLSEGNSAGRSDLKVTLTGDNLCIKNYDTMRHCGFFRQSKGMGFQKCVDHIILQNRNGQWILHMIEMKTTVGAKTWLGEIKPKFRASYLNMAAFLAVLGIYVEEARAYTTYETDKLSAQEMNKTPDPISCKPLLGIGAYDPKQEWLQGTVHLNIGDMYAFRHQKIQMTRKDNVLHGGIAF